MSLTYLAYELYIDLTDVECKELCLTLYMTVTNYVFVIHCAILTSKLSD